MDDRENLKNAFVLIWNKSRSFTPCDLTRKIRSILLEPFSTQNVRVIFLVKWEMNHLIFQ